MTTTLFTDLQGSSIPSSADAVRSSGFRVVGRGAADYIRADSTFGATLPSTAQNVWWFAAADGSRFYLSPGQDLTFEMFGAHGDFSLSSGTGTDDLPTWQSAVQYLVFFGRMDDHPYYRSLLPLRFGPYRYRFSDYLDLADGSFTLIGSSRGGAIGGRGSIFYFDAGAKSGIVVNSYNTAGIDDVKADGISAGGTMLINIHLISRGNGSGSLAWKQDGFRIKTGVTMQGCSATDFSRNNLRLVATNLSNDGTTQGLANGCQFINCDFLYAGGSNVLIAGADVNVSQFTGGNCLYAGEFGIDCNSFLGVKFESVHTNGNGTLAGPTWMTGTRKASLVSSGGRVYYVKPGQAANAASHQPGVTSGWETVWGDVGAGGPGSTIPSWSSSGNFVEGGPYRSQNLNELTYFDSCYSEQGQAPAVIAQRTILMGGLQGAGVSGEGFDAHSDFNQLVSSKGYTSADGSLVSTLRAQTGSGNVLEVGHSTLAPLHYSLAFDGTELRFRYANSSELPFVVYRIPTSGSLAHRLCVDSFGLGYGNSKRLHSQVAGPPSSSDGQNGDVRWNDQSDSTYAGVDYWYKKGGAWVARP
jgi:hypothetical protein